MMRIISWNVNSFSKRFNQILELWTKLKPDILMLQETRNAKINLQVKQIMSPNGDMAYTYHCCNGGRNGVAIISKFPLEVVTISDRLIHCKDDKFNYISVYVPNGGSKSASVEHKLEFLNNLLIYSKLDNLILAGDFNVCTWDENTLDKKLYSENEINAFCKLKNCFVSPIKGLTWWHYWPLHLKRNIGLGLDKIFLSKNLRGEGYILKSYRFLPLPSDHAPVQVIINN